MSNSLVVVPCGRHKIWDSYPDRGATPASEVYTSSVFSINRAYAEKFGDRWIILSAKYGFIDPSFEIPGPYDVSFNQPKSSPISIASLRAQIKGLQIDPNTLVVVLGGKAYREAAAAAFSEHGARLVYPFAGLPLGRMLQATKRAIATGDPNFLQEIPDES